jgi:DNA-binding NarL/FixJ family response regulator
MPPMSETAPLIRANTGAQLGAGFLGPSDVSTPPELPEVSNREIEVLALVAGGLSNEEVAARIYLSVRTVERHLSNIYAKLRVSGKAARAAAAARSSRSRSREAAGGHVHLAG